MQDRRQINRWQINYPAKFKPEETEDFVDCKIKDISFKGIQISSSQKLQRDAFLKFRIMFSGEFSFEVEVWMVWHKSVDGTNLYGFYFSKIKDSDKERISEFLHSNFPEVISKQIWKGLIPGKGGEEMEDRRIFERFKAQFPLRLLDLKENKEGQAQVCDISAKGVGFVTNMQLRPYTPVEMWLQIPDKHEPLYTRGEVVWSKLQGANEYRTGVNLERSDLMGIARVLRTM